MKAFLKLLPILLLGLIVLGWVVGRTLPERYTIASALEIEAPPADVYRWVHDAEGWKRWFTGPQAEVRVEAPDRLVLVHEEVEHVLELTETSSPTSVAYRHFAESAPLDPVDGRLDIAPQQGASRVRIEEVVQVEGSTQRWIVYLFGADLMTQVLDRELHNLKSLVETGKTHGAKAAGPARGAR